MSQLAKFLQATGISFAIFISCQNTTFSQIERFAPKQGGSTEIWRITNNPSIRNWANYHNTDAWSPDGRYICYEKYEPYDINPEKKVYIYDLHLDKEIDIGKGYFPRWANNNNWLFYVLPVPGDRPTDDKKNKLIWLDVDNNKSALLATGVSKIGETDFADRWVYAYTNEYQFRVPIKPDSRVEIMESNPGIFWIPNPFYPAIFVRVKDDKDQPFKATRTFSDLEGKNITIASPQIQRCHQAWSGDGEYYMHGGPLISGRKWNEPFPSNLHVLSAIGCGDVSACGKSGRWVCGSSNITPLTLADLWSGDGWRYLRTALSYIHDSDKYSYNQGSALNDNDSKGSADGTKIVFSSNYDLKDGPLTDITEDADASTDRINVISTDGFPSSGTLSIGNEIIGYSKKTATSFEGLTRNMYNTTGQNLDFEWPLETLTKEFNERKSDEEFINKYTFKTFGKLKALLEKTPVFIRKGDLVTSFDARLIPENLRKTMKMPTFFTSADFHDDKDSPLLWQRRTDVYVAIVRLPDQPCLNKTTDGVELIPGENHWETFGYDIYKDDVKITKKPLRPGDKFILSSQGKYAATAIEWSGLRSEKSQQVELNAGLKLTIRTDKPADFSWTYDRWLVDGKEVTKEAALISAEAVKEMVHRVEGILHREWYNWGQITRRYDLRADGEAIRRLHYTNGIISKREYYAQGTSLVSVELFDSQGKYITESIQYKTVDGKLKETEHFWYEGGCPVKFAGTGGRHAGESGLGIYKKEGDKWLKKQSVEIQ